SRQARRRRRRGMGELSQWRNRLDPRLLRDRLRQHLSSLPALPTDALRPLARAVRARARAAARLPPPTEPAALAGVPLPLEELTVEIDSLDAEGRGVARKPDGKVLFVEGALPGERARVAIVEHKRRHEFARALAIENASAERRAPRCPHFGICGGCVTQHATLQAQLAAKQDWLLQNLARIGKVTPERVTAPISGAEWGYRHRARLSVRRVPKKGGVLVGFRERRSTYVAELGECAVLPEHVSALIVPLKALVEKLSVRARLPQIEVAVGDNA